MLTSRNPLRILIFLFSVAGAVAQVRINEFVASNKDGLKTSSGINHDWIELINVGSSTALLDGYALTDDPNALRKWSFPVGISLDPGQFLIVFASGDPTTPDELHASFKLSADGEYLALIGPGDELLTEFSPEYPPQGPDIAYGVSDDGLRRGYFLTPTPEAANGEPVGSWVKDTVFSVARGIYSSPFDLSISSETPGAIIRYTLDGSTPTVDHGLVYEQPLGISGTTVVRAMAFKEDALPTNVDTHTYLFVSDVTTQNADGLAPPGWPTGPVNGQVYDYGMDPDITERYTQGELENALTAIPSIMVTVDQEDFTSPDTGIHSNAEFRGRSWERPAHVEFFSHDLDETLAARCGLRIRGGYSRRDYNPKHSLRLFFRSEYGLNTLKAPLFGAEGTDEFEKLDLRFDQSFSFMRANRHRWATYLHELVTRDLQREAGQPFTRSRYHHIYINGIYWGLGMTQERPEANFGASYLGGEADDYDVLKSGGSQNGYSLEAANGEVNGDWRALWQLARDQFANPTTARYFEMQGLGPDGGRDPTLPVLLDVDNLIHYMLVLAYSGAYDNSLSIHIGGSNNWFSIRNRESDDQGFVHFLHDGENSFGAASDGWIAWSDRLNITKWDFQRASYLKSNPQFLHFDLAQSTPEYQRRFGDLAHAALFNGGYLTADRVLSLINNHATTIDQAIIAETARWGDFTIDPPADREGWLASVEVLRELVNERRPLLLSNLREAGLYSEHAAAVYAPFSSQVAGGSEITVTAPEGSIYATVDGSDPLLADGSINPNANLIASGNTITVLEPMFLKTRVLWNGEWSPITTAYYTTYDAPGPGELAFSALMVDPADPSEHEIAAGFGGSGDFEYVELVNLSARHLDLSGAKLQPIVVGDRLEGLRYSFPEMTVLEPGQRLVVAANLGAFAFRFPVPDPSRIVGPFDGRLGNGGEGLLMVGADGDELIRLRYDNAAPWPAFLEGEALFSTRLNRAAFASDGSNWMATAPEIPGVTPTERFLGNAIADHDGDGASALLEYFLGESDDDGVSVNTKVRLDGTAEDQYAVFTFQRDPAALNVIQEVRISNDFSSWQDATSMTLLERTLLDGGLVLESYRMPVPLGFEKRLFIRLVVSAE